MIPTNTISLVGRAFATLAKVLHSNRSLGTFHSAGKIKTRLISLPIRMIVLKQWIVITYPTFIGFLLPGISSVEMFQITHEMSLPKGCLRELCPNGFVQENLVCTALWA